MKKLLTLMLVLGMAGVASAGFTVTAPEEVMAGEAFDVVISGLWADVGGGITGGVYGDIMPVSGAAEVAAGNLGKAIPVPSWGGYDFIVGDVEDGDDTNDPGDGNWIVLSYVASDVVGTVHELGIYDYAVSAVDPIGTALVEVIIPEPMTIGLLGLGALFLRRRK